MQTGFDDINTRVDDPTRLKALGLHTNMNREEERHA